MEEFNCIIPKNTFEEMQKQASLYAGFDISKPADLSALQIDTVSHQVEEHDYGNRRFILTTKLRGYLESEFSLPEELTITIVRKTQQLPRKK